MFFKTLNSKERITRAIVHLQDEHPFFSYILMKLNISEDGAKNMPKLTGMGVNTKNELIWKDDFVKKLNDEELKFCLVHEVMHLALLHLIRLGSREIIRFNIACDIVVNNILSENMFRPPNDLLVPDNGSIDIFGQIINNISQKNAEMIYDELEDNKKIKRYNGFDEHHYSDDMTKKKSREISDRWKDYMSEAAVHAKNRGKIPHGMDLMIDKLLNSKIPWRQVIHKHITQLLPYDYSFSRRNKKIQDVYLPGIVKETLDIVVHVDTSGSISQKVLTQFMSEVYAILRTYENVIMTLIIADCEICSVERLDKASRVIDVEIKGGGGTSHSVVFDYIDKNLRSTRLLVSLTDGYSDIEECPRPAYDILFVMPRDSEKNLPFGRIVEIN